MQKFFVVFLDVKCIWGQEFGRTFVSERLAWPGVEVPGDLIQLLLSEDAQVGSLGEVLAPQTIGVFVAIVLNS